MYVCMYVCMHVCIYIIIYLYSIYIYICTCKCTFKSLSTLPTLRIRNILITLKTAGENFELLLGRLSPRAMSTTEMTKMKTSNRFHLLSQ